MAAIMFNVDLPFFPPFIHLFPFVVPPPARPLPSPSERSWAGIQEGPAQTETAGGGKWKERIRGDRSGRGESRVWNRSTEPAPLIESFLLLKERKKGRKKSFCAALSLANSGAETTVERWRGFCDCERLQLALPPDAQHGMTDVPRKCLCSASCGNRLYRRMEGPHTVNGNV